MMKCLLSFLAGAAAGWLFANFNSHSASVSTASAGSDTVLRVDTVLVSVPQAVTRTVVRHDTIRIACSGVSDSIDVALPVAQSHYIDPCGEAWVSGWHARLDSMRFYPSTVTVTRTQTATPRRWHIGVTAGVTATAHGIAPGVSVGVTYSFFSF